MVVIARSLDACERQLPPGEAVKLRSSFSRLHGGAPPGLPCVGLGRLAGGAAGAEVKCKGSFFFFF